MRLLHGMEDALRFTFLLALRFWATTVNIHGIKELFECKMKQEKLNALVKAG